MAREEYILKRLSLICNTGVFRVQEGVLSCYQDGSEYNPLFCSDALRKELMITSDGQQIPCIYKDEYQVMYACMKEGTQYYLIGPMSIEGLKYVDLHQYYKKYGIHDTADKRLKRFAFSEVLDVVGMLGSLLSGTEYKDEELLNANHIVFDTKAKEEKEQILFDLKKDEEELYHHTYQEERKLLDSVRDGRVEDALRLSRNMDAELGRLSSKELNHWKNAAVVAITLCTRAAIEGGVSPAIAYRLSDFYIQKSDECNDIVRLIECRNHAVEELTRRVMQKQQNRGTSSYVERCKDYVRMHYREKIYQEDLAQLLGISTSYLSRLFSRETGVKLQDYVNQIRVEYAGNLLLYSEEPIARIAEYVNFPSQSYFGKIFKEYKHMSPKKYRELNKPTEFFKTK